jgi:heterodisulfide reductase subunit A
MTNKTDKSGAVLVIGGGIAGMQTSLDLAEMGYYVYLVEKKPAIGGRMAQLDKVFPTAAKLTTHLWKYQDLLTGFLGPVNETPT